MGRTRFVAVLALLMLVPAFAAGANPPDRFEQPDFVVVHDFQNDLAVFWNVTKESYCAWVEDPTPDPLPEVLKDLEFTFVQAGNGYSTQSYNETSDIELWVLNGGSQDDVCLMNGEPWAQGVARASLRDIQDPDTVGTFLSKIHGQGTVFESETGDPWHYSWTTLVSIDETGDNHVVEEFNLRVMGS